MLSVLPLHLLCQKIWEMLRLHSACRLPTFIPACMHTNCSFSESATFADDSLIAWVGNERSEQGDWLGSRQVGWRACLPLSAGTCFCPCFSGGFAANPSWKCLGDWVGQQGFNTSLPFDLRLRQVPKFASWMTDQTGIWWCAMKRSGAGNTWVVRPYCSVPLPNSSSAVQPVRQL